MKRNWRAIFVHLLWLSAGGLLLAGCSLPAAAPARVPATPPPLRLPTGAACAGLPDDRAETAPPAPNTDADDIPVEPSEATVKWNPKQPLLYDQPSNTIVLGPGAPASLPALARALGRDDLLRALGPGEWLLTANLWVGAGAELAVAAPEARRLKLRSDADGFVWVKAYGGRLSFVGACVTSWDQRRGAVASDPGNGRSFVLARAGAHMEIRDSELSYLGYYANESYGVAWRQPGTSGAAINSRFGHNFYGLYSYAASDLLIRDNEVHHSVRYGIDPHTRADRLVIEDNIAHHNGKQGIILAEECNDSVIRNNTVFANSLHGIVIYQRSNNNLVEGNISYGNALHGINVNASAGTIVRGNSAFDNGEAGIGVGQGAANTLLAGNTVRDNRKDGIYLFSAAVGTTLRDNSVSGNPRYGIYVKSAGNTIGPGNQVFENGVGIFLDASPPPEVSLESNQVYANREENLRVAR